MTDDKKTETSSAKNDEWKANKKVLMNVRFRKEKFVGSDKHEQKQ
jgi:hypothetical protein